MKCTNRIIMKAGEYHQSYMYVNCGKCLACRINRKKEWSLRLQHELLYYKKSMFLTLTYDDSHLKDLSLHKKDLQLFFKRIRKKRKIKYFAVGEYGEERYRPHYHAIIYNMSWLDVNDKLEVAAKWPLCDWNIPDIARRSFEPVNQQSINYVAGYMVDKLSDYANSYLYDEQGLEKPFRLLSNGLGARYMQDNAERIKDNMYCQVNDVKHPIPRFYRKELNITEKDYRVLIQLSEYERYSDIITHDSDKKLYISPNEQTKLAIEEDIRAKQRDSTIRSRLAMQKKRDI